MNYPLRLLGHFNAAVGVLPDIPFLIARVEEHALVLITAVLVREVDGLQVITVGPGEDDGVKKP